MDKSRTQHLQRNLALELGVAGLAAAILAKVVYEASARDALPLTAAGCGRHGRGARNRSADAPPRSGASPALRIGGGGLCCLSSRWLRPRGCARLYRDVRSLLRLHREKKWTA